MSTPTPNPSDENTRAAAFISRFARQLSPPDLPELQLWLADEVTPLWEATSAVLAHKDVEPPYWAFAWPGGIALARYLLDNPDLVAGRSVLDLAAGSGLVGLAAAKAGARSVLLADTDPTAVVAIQLNAIANHCSVDATSEDLLGAKPPDVEVVVAGDVCYEQPMAGRVLAFLNAAAAQGATVLLADPGRQYLPSNGLRSLATLQVQTSRNIESTDLKTVTVWELRTSKEPGLPRQ